MPSKATTQTSRNPKPKVIDLSSKTIDINAQSALCGLKFTFVPRENIIELRSDIRKFCRKVRLTEFFTIVLKKPRILILLNQKAPSHRTGTET